MIDIVIAIVIAWFLTLGISLSIFVMLELFKRVNEIVNRIYYGLINFLDNKNA